MLHLKFLESLKQSSRLMVNDICERGILYVHAIRFIVDINFCGMQSHKLLSRIQWDPKFRTVTEIPNALN